MLDRASVYRVLADRSNLTSNKFLPICSEEESPLSFHDDVPVLAVCQWLLSFDKSVSFRLVASRLDTSPATATKYLQSPTGPHPHDPTEGQGLAGVPGEICIMVRNIVVLGGSSHPQLTQTICNHLGVPPANVLLDKFAVGETRVEIKESVRGKDVYIIQSGGGKVNDHLMELLISISACKTASARQVTAVLPLFPYSRQSDIPYNKTGPPLAKAGNCYNKPGFPYVLDSVPPTPHPDHVQSPGLANSTEGLNKSLLKMQLEESNSSPNSPQHARFAPYMNGHNRTDTSDPGKSLPSDGTKNGSMVNGPSQEDSSSANGSSQKYQVFTPQPGYKQWVAQAGTLVADLLTCAGADHIITMDLHDAQYQGFFDIPVDNLYGRPLLKRYIQYQIPDYKQAVIVSPDAGGAKRATAIADGLEMPFALIHKVSNLLQQHALELTPVRNVDLPRSLTVKPRP